MRTRSMPAFSSALSGWATAAALILRSSLCLLPAVPTGCIATPDPLPRYMQDAPRTEEEVRRAIEEIRGELGDGFIIDHIDGIFFLAADGGVDEYRRCRATIERMYRFLMRDFFEKRPGKPIRIYCFREADGYERYCKATYRRPPSTPFGFYMPAERKMVMNIATGTGTLAHETVHPLLAEDFPTVPSWFNEGFASLYEQSRQTVDERMEGLVNWRLKGLKEALKEGRAIPLEELLKTSSKEFYDETRGVNYATARYLCKWLQDQDKLKPFYRQFRAAADRDPTGRAVLEKVTGMSVEKMDRVWRAWVLALK
ncbi:MAG: hypothetical protein HYY16_16360 [Planctomycetes bacterium]|nr:hypothetical protein [Planctomycetota bacterium]